MGIRVQGMEAVTKELERIRATMAPALGAAIDDATKFGRKTAVDAIFNQYGFKSKSYVESHFSVSFNPRTLTGYISSRRRSSTANQFITSAHFRTGKKGQRVPIGYTIAYIRNEPVWFKGAFNFIGKNGNQVMYVRDRGQKWRTFKEARKDYKNKGAYGPSVAISFRNLADEIEPPIIKFLRERYLYHASK